MSEPRAFTMRKPKGIDPSAYAIKGISQSLVTQIPSRRIPHKRKAGKLLIFCARPALNALEQVKFRLAGRAEFVRLQFICGANQFIRAARRIESRKRQMRRKIA